MDNLVSNISTPFLITSDANAHHPSWGSSYSDQRGRLIDSWIDNNDVGLLNTGEPTYTHTNNTMSHIDLFIVSNNLILDLSWQPYHDNLFSDHFPLIISSSITTDPPVPVQRWCLKTGVWNKYVNSLNIPGIDSFSSPTQACSTVTESILHAAKLRTGLTNGIREHKLSKCWLCS